MLLPKITSERRTHMAKTIYEQSAELHKRARGKLEVKLKVPLNSREDLSKAYTPGVAEPCRIIAKDKSAVYDYTAKGNTVAVVTDGTAVLGLGDIGPEAALLVMEGKAALFKQFAGVDAWPICLDTKDPKEIVAIVKAIAPGFGGINLEDISAPRCVEIERTLKEELNIPVFHDDQHGTAIVVAAAIMNATYLVRKPLHTVTVVVSGAGAAGSSVINMLHNLEVKEIYAFDKDGIITEDDYDKYNFLNKELSRITNRSRERISMAEAMTKADVFVGVSKGGIVTPDMVAGMKENPIVFAMANPEPEITRDLALKAGARIVGTGRSDYPNQINNVLAFPGLFRGALDCRATKITEEMKVAAANALADLVSDEEICEDYIIPSAMDPRVADAVAEAVAKKAIEQGLARI